MATRKAATKSGTPANLKYGEAKERLEGILDELESNEVDIDDLADRIKEARDLIRVLNDKLTRTKGEVEKVMRDFADEAAADAEARAPAEESAESGSADEAPAGESGLPF